MPALLRPSLIRFAFTKLSIALFAMAAAACARAQTTITWGTATTISGVSDVSLNGTLIGAFSFYRNDPGTGGTDSTNNPVVNGVTFSSLEYTQTGSGTSGVTLKWSAVDFANNDATFASPAGTFTSGSNPFASLNGDYKTLLASAAYTSNGINPSGPFTGKIHLTGLTVGYTYEVEFWSNDPRGGGTLGRNATFIDGQIHTVTLALNNGSNAGSVGQFVTGVFVAQSSTFDISIVSGGGGDNLGVQINAVQLRMTAIPEPSTYAIIAGACALGAVVARRYATRKA